MAKDTLHFLLPLEMLKEDLSASLWTKDQVIFLAQKKEAAVVSIKLNPVLGLQLKTGADY